MKKLLEYPAELDKLLTAYMKNKGIKSKTQAIIILLYEGLKK